MQNIYKTGLVILFVLIFIDTSHAESFGINIYGLSYHTGVKNYNRDLLNEINRGIGFRANFGKKNGNAIFIEGGKYIDSFNNDAKYISFGYKLRIWHQLRFGINATMYNSKSTNRGETFFAPVPILSYRIWRVIFNSVYLPKYGKINPFNTYGAYLTFIVVQGK